MKYTKQELQNIHFAVSVALDMEIIASAYPGDIVNCNLIRYDGENSKYHLTEGGEMYVNALAAVPFPEMVWQMPDRD